MADAPQYWSPAFVERFVEALNTDENFQNTARSFSSTIELRCLETPVGDDVSARYAFESGQVVDVDLWMDEAPSEEMRNEPFDSSTTLARATAPYDVWVKLDTGELGVTAAITSPDYTIDGPMLKIMSNIGIFRGLNRVAAEVDKTY